MKCLTILIALFAFTAAAADLTGKWKATAEGPNGSMERTFDFKVEGAKLTGETVSSMMGKSTLANGKVEGDNFSFTITVKFQDNEMQVSSQRQGHRQRNHHDRQLCRRRSDHGVEGRALPLTPPLLSGKSR